MDDLLKQLIERLRRDHLVIDAAGDAARQCGDFQARTGYELPHDMREFYSVIAQANLFDYRYVLMPITEWRRTGEFFFGEPWRDSGPESWYAFCDVMDGDGVGIDLSPFPFGGNDVLDLDHEDTRNCRIIANSFTEFLGRALEEGDEQLFYLHPEFRPLRTIEKVDYLEPPEELRKLPWVITLYAEVGPELCTVAGCPRKHIARSTLCRQHHYEHILGRPYPYRE